MKMLFAIVMSILSHSVLYADLGDPTEGMYAAELNAAQSGLVVSIGLVATLWYWIIGCFNEHEKPENK